MTTYLLFCTAEVSTETINKLLKQPETNYLVLAKDPSQTCFDHWRTNPPISPFKNGFLGWNASQIQQYLRDQLSESALDPQTNITGEEFAILDQRSIEDETVLIYQLLDENLTREPSSDDEEDEDEEKEVWWSWRVRFADVDELIGGLETLEALPKYCSDQFLGGDGIFDARRATEAYANGWKAQPTS